jgi:outer membrane protein OmpA-like peptidoglycan-associated protein
MAAQQRDGDRDTADSAARIWQLYADHIGLPDARPAEDNESLPVPLQPSSAPSRPRASRLRTAAVAVGSGVSIVVVALLAAVAGTALWSSWPTPVVVTEPPAPTQPPVPIARADNVKIAERPATLAAAPAPRAADTPVAPPMSHGSAPASAARPAGGETPSGIPSAVVPKPERASFGDSVNFDFGSDRLAGESLRALDKIVLAMKANPDWQLAIEGHTDSHGPPEYNQELSERRAEAVKVHLESAGIAPHRLRALGFGATRPVVPNDGRRDFLNRRVDLRRR